MALIDTLIARQEREDAWFEAWCEDNDADPAAPDTLHRYASAMEEAADRF